MVSAAIGQLPKIAAKKHFVPSLECAFSWERRAPARLNEEPRWPYFLFHLSERVEEIRAMGSGSTYPEVSRSKFRELEAVA